MLSFFVRENLNINIKNIKKYMNTIYAKKCGGGRNNTICS